MRKFKQRIEKDIQEYPRIQTFLTTVHDAFSKTINPHRPVPVYEDIGAAYFLIPKAATRSINYVFLKKTTGFEPDEIGREKQRYEQPFREAMNLDIFKFSFVRNPFSRLVSCYKDKIHRRSSVTKKYFGLLRDVSFKTFVRRINRIPVRYMERHFKPQHALLSCKGELQPEYIGRIEVLEEDFQQVQDECDVTFPPRLNSTKKEKDWRAYYDRETARITYEIYEKDCDEWYHDAYEEILTFIDNQ